MEFDSNVNLEIGKLTDVKLVYLPSAQLREKHRRVNKGLLLI